MTRLAGLDDPAALEREQLRLAGLDPPRWRPGPSLVAGAAFVAFARGEQGPGATGDHAFVGAAASREASPLARVVVEGRAGAPYRPGFLAAREGVMLEDALLALLAVPVDVDVVLVDATGRDHPRRAGLAVQLGEALGLPTVGVTHRPLLATGPEPVDEIGASAELAIDGDAVGCLLRVQRGVRPLVVHPAWRTDTATAVEVVLRVTGDARTPEPLRLARVAAREARAAAEHRGRR